MMGGGGVDDYVEIPPEQLTPEALQALIEAFITREGTDYGCEELTLAQKVAQVRQQLSAGRGLIVFDTQTQSCTVRLKDEG